MLLRLYINLTHCIETTGCWSEIIFVISHKKNIVFGKKFEISFHNILASFTEFQFQGTNTFDFIREKTFEIHIQRKFLHE